MRTSRTNVSGEHPRIMPMSRCAPSSARAVALVASGLVPSEVVASVCSAVCSSRHHDVFCTCEGSAASRGDPFTGMEEFTSPGPQTVGSDTGTGTQGPTEDTVDTLDKARRWASQKAPLASRQGIFVAGSLARLKASKGTVSKTLTQEVPQGADGQGRQALQQGTPAAQERSRADSAPRETHEAPTRVPELQFRCAAEW